MLGVVGVAPPAGEAFLNSRNGPYGGNLDAQELTTGATVILPVFVEGALLHVGDMHALQGDGEICGWGGIETRGRASLTVELAEKPASMTMPRFENPTHVGAFGCARPAEDAFRQSTFELIGWMVEEYGFAREEAFMLLGSVMEARCTQFVNPTFTYVSKVKKEYVEWKSSG
jgi:acetamidase/formamidase